MEYPKTLHMLHSDLLFLPEKMEINKCPKLVCNLNDKENYSIHIVALKQALNLGLVLRKVHSVISFRQEAWLMPYIALNTELKKNMQKMNLKKTFTSYRYMVKLTTLHMVKLCKMIENIEIIT